MAIRFTISGYATRGENELGMHDSFIGRQDLIEDVIFRCKRGMNSTLGYSGLFRNGKSSLMKEVIRQMNQEQPGPNGLRTVGVYYQADQWVSGEHLALEDILEAVHEQLTSLDLADEKSQELYALTYGNKDRDKVELNFVEYTRLQQRRKIAIKLFIDEFQCVIVKKGCTFRDISFICNLPLTKIFVGRLPFESTINKMTDYTSKVSLPCAQFSVKGFDDNDIEEYKKVFADEHQFDLTPFMGRILHHCGRSPYLLAYIGEELQCDLEKGRANRINNAWFDERFESYNFDYYTEYNTKNVLREDKFKDIDNMERLMRIFIGPRYGIRKADFTIMQQMGYIDNFGENHFAVTPSFLEWMATQECTGDVMSKLKDAERLLKRHIRVHSDAVMAKGNPENAPNKTGKLIWSPLDKAILTMPMRLVPEDRKDISRFGEEYHLEHSDVTKYANYVLTDVEKGHPADLMEKLLLRERLGILLSCWDVMGTPFGENMHEWREQFICWNSVRNPAMHASDYLTDVEEALCERCCEQVIRVLGPLYPEKLKDV